MNVAIVKLSALGDVVHSLPVAAAFRAAHPDARIAWLVETRHAPVLRGHPALDAVIPIDTRRWRRARTPGALVGVAREVRALRRTLRGAHFDVALDLQGLVKSGIVTAATGARVRVGFRAGWCRERANTWFTNRRVTPGPGARHVVDQYLALLGALGIAPPAHARFDLPADAASEASVAAALAAAGVKADDRLVVLNPGAARPEKRWPADRVAALARMVAGETRGRALVLWGPGEVDAARSIAMAGDATLAPPTDLLGLVALLRRAHVVVSADTGPLHVAAALGVACVGLFGPTSAHRNGPYGRFHRTLQAPDGHMISIGVDAVLHAVRELLR